MHTHKHMLLVLNAHLQEDFRANMKKRAEVSSEVSCVHACSLVMFMPAYEEILPFRVVLFWV